MSRNENTEKLYSTKQEIDELFADEEFNKILEIGKYTSHTLNSETAYNIISCGFSFAGDGIVHFAENFGNIYGKSRYRGAIPDWNLVVTVEKLPIALSKKEVVRLVWQIGEFSCRHCSIDTNRLKEPALSKTLAAKEHDGTYRYCAAATKLFRFYSTLNVSELGVGVLDDIFDKGNTFVENCEL